VWPSGQDNEERGEVHEQEDCKIAHWSEEEWGEEWKQWEFGGEYDVEEDQEYEEDEEDDDDDKEEEEEAEKEEEEEEEEKGKGVASVPTDLCVVCVTRPRNASIIRDDTGHQVCCFECVSRLKTEKQKIWSEIIHMI